MGTRGPWTAASTFLSHLLPFLPHLHLFSPFSAHPRTGQMLFTEAAVCSEPVPQSPNQDSAAVGVGGCDSVARGRMGEGPSEQGADKACNLPVSLSVSHRSPRPLLPHHS